MGLWKHRPTLDFREGSADEAWQMPLVFPSPDHMPCPDCGASVAVASRTGHVCDAERLLDYRLVELRPEIDGFEGDLETWLETATGRFARFLAERDRP